MHTYKEHLKQAKYGWGDQESKVTGQRKTTDLAPYTWFLLSCSVMSISLQPHELHHARLPCPSPTPRACSNSCPLSRWCHPTISSSVVPFSSCSQPFPASRSCLMSWFFASGGQSYWSFSFSLSPSREYSELISFRMDWSCSPCRNHPEGVQPILFPLSLWDHSCFLCMYPPS